MPWYEIEVVSRLTLAVEADEKQEALGCAISKYPTADVEVVDEAEEEDNSYAKLLLRQAYVIIWKDKK